KPHDLVALPGFEPDEFDLRSELVELDRKIRGRMLPAERLLEHLVAAMNADLVARNIGRRKERESHDVIPVHMGHEHVVRARILEASCSDDLVAERPRAGAHVAE